jgi:hypothetical protein
VCALAHWPFAIRASAQVVAVFVKLGDDDDFAEVAAPAGASVAALKELVVAKLKLEAPPNRVTLTKFGEGTPLDSRMTVLEALGDAGSLSLIVKVLATVAASAAPAAGA